MPRAKSCFCDKCHKCKNCQKAKRYYDQNSYEVCLRIRLKRRRMTSAKLKSKKFEAEARQRLTESPLRLRDSVASAQKGISFFAAPKQGILVTNPTRSHSLANPNQSDEVISDGTPGPKTNLRSSESRESTTSEDSYGRSYIVSSSVIE